MAEIHNNQLIYSLKFIHQYAFTSRTIRKLMVLTAEARKIPASTYTTHSQEIFSKEKGIDDDREFIGTIIANEALIEVLLCVTLDMEKLFPV